MRAYIAGPYSNNEVSNTRNAILYANSVLNAGHSPFVPHLCMFWDLLAPRSYEQWIDYGLSWLEVCDVVLCLGASPGTDREIARAKELNIPVYYTFTEFIHETTRTDCAL